MGTVSASLELVDFSQYSTDAQLAADYPYGEKYVG